MTPVMTTPLTTMTRTMMRTNARMGVVTLDVDGRRKRQTTRVRSRAATTMTRTRTRANDDGDARTERVRGETTRTRCAHRRTTTRTSRDLVLVRTTMGANATEDEGKENVRELCARELTMRVMRNTIRDAPPSAMIALVAVVWAQTVNLGGTFALALVHAHTVPIVAATFTVSVAIWKFICSTLVRIAVMRESERGDAYEWRDFKGNFMKRATAREAVEALKSSRASCKALLTLDFRRVVSLLWNTALTFPIPYMALIRLLDYAIAGPVLLLEQKTSGEALKRSQELMYGYRVLLMKTAFLCSTVASILVGSVIGVFVLLVPTLPELLLPPFDASTTMTVGDVAQGFFSGTAFDRVWQIGSATERSATLALLVCGLALSFFFTLGFRELVYTFYKETKARYVPPLPEEPKEKKPWLRRLQFWRKDGGA